MSEKIANNGSESEAAFVEMITRNRGKLVYVFRLTDTKEIMGAMGKGFTKKNPSDYIVTLNGHMFYAEVKSTQEKVSFKFSSFTKGQIIGMTRQIAAGGKYNIYIHHIPSNTWYLLDGSTVLNEMKKKVKSIKFTMIPKLMM